MKLVCKVKIKNTLGLHARPATLIAKLLQSSKCSVTFSYKNETINAKSIMSILMLAATKNTIVTITADGPDAAEIVEKLKAAFENKFGE